MSVLQQNFAQSVPAEKKETSLDQNLRPRLNRRRQVRSGTHYGHD